MFLLIDNYDSFTWNLWHALHAVGVPCRVYRNDVLSAQAFLELRPRALILSPGPATPDQAGNVPELLARAPSSLPILGVCLGHQAIAEAFGGTLEVQTPPSYGKVSRIVSYGTGLMAETPDSFRVARYHALRVVRDSLPACFVIDAQIDAGLLGQCGPDTPGPTHGTEPGLAAETVMAFHHSHRPVFGVQFHPESIATEHGHQVLRNFARVCLNHVPDGDSDRDSEAASDFARPPQAAGGLREAGPQNGETARPVGA